MNKTEDTFQIKNKWLLDAGGAIYLIKDQLLFYSESQDPTWGSSQKITRSQLEATKCYKQHTFNSWDDIPNDCAMSF